MGGLIQEKEEDGQDLRRLHPSGMMGRKQTSKKSSHELFCIAIDFQASAGSTICSAV